VPESRPSERTREVPRAARIAGEGSTHAIELVLTPLVLAVAGIFVDRWLGTAPVFTVALCAFGVVGSFATTWYRYEARMKRLDVERRSAASPHKQAA
jgi:F0F1-type ATP synthase assembly protein I